MLQGSEEVMYSGLQSRSEWPGSTLARNKDGVPIWAGDLSTFEEYVEACLMYEQTVVREKRYLCGPRCASKLRGSARRILVGKPANWLSHSNGVRVLVAALREERGHPKVPEMSELLMKYFKGSKRQRGESMHDYIMKKAEAYTRAQQSMARLQRETRRREPHTSTGSQSTSAQGSGPAPSGAESNTTPEEEMLTPREGDDEEESEGWWDWGQGEWGWSRERGWFQLQPRGDMTATSELGRKSLPEIVPD